MKLSSKAVPAYLVLASILATFILAGISTACAAPSVATVQGTVTEVRITGAVISQGNSGGDAVGGALVGGLFFGIPGAVLGAAAGSSGTDNVVLRGEVIACKAFVRLEDGTLLAFTASASKPECSLLRKGDVLLLTKYRGHYSWDLGSMGLIDERGKPVPASSAPPSPDDLVK